MTATFQDHFSSVAHRYADFRPHYPPALFDYLATLVPRNSFVWDCACGNGQATLDLAQRFDRVIATDASREQVASAISHPRVKYRVAPAEQSGLPNKSAALITVAQSLHWFDLTRFYAEVQRVLRPGGVLAVWAYGVTEVEGAMVNQLVQNFYTHTVGSYWPPERELVERGYRDIELPFGEITAPVFRMKARWTLDQLLGYFSTWSATNRCIEATGSNPLYYLAEDLACVWGDTAVPRSVTWPLSLRITRHEVSPT